MFAATVFAATMRSCGMRGCGVDAPAAVAGACGRWSTSPIGCVTASSVVPASASAAEAMPTPAVAVSPVRPRPHAEEDAVIEIAGPVEPARCTAVRCIVVVAVGTDWRYAYAYADSDLRTGHRHQGQGHEQDCRTGQKQTAHCELASPRGHVLELQHFLILRNFRLRSKAISPVSGSCS